MDYELETLHLLVELDNERARARRRESVFLSIIVHLVVILLLLMEPHIFKSVRQSLGLAEQARPHQQLTYLALPPDDQVLKIKPKTSVLSDKDRLKRPGVAEVAPPKLPPLPEKPKGAESEKKQLAQALPLPPLPQQRPEDAKPKQEQPAAPPLQLGDVRNEQPKLTLPPAGRTLDDTLRAMARNRGAGSQGAGSVGDVVPPEGFNPRMPAAIGPAQILSDTQGVNFDPYLARVVASIRRNWYAVMPEIARLGKRGRVVVIFDVQHDGGVPKLYLVSTSGSDPLDRAALASISASVPFQPLPDEFKGPILRLQVTFLYNMFQAQ